MKIRSVLSASGLIAAVIISPSTYATTLPFGVQNDVSSTTVTGWGFTQLYSSRYDASGDSIAAILSSLSSTDYLMMAARRIGSSTFDVLAVASLADVTFNTGTGNTTHQANGAEWYFDPDWSWGFAGLNDTVNRDSCDLQDVNNTNPNPSNWTAIERDRLCWHTDSGLMDGGWRSGDNIALNDSTDWEKVLLKASAIVNVPEPTTLAMLGLGIAGIRLASRKTV